MQNMHKTTHDWPLTGVHSRWPIGSETHFRPVLQKSTGHFEPQRFEQNNERSSPTIITYYDK